MEQVCFKTALWRGMALTATLLSMWLRVSMALTKIVTGTVPQLIPSAAIGSKVLGVKACG
jgi:glutathione-regulated potassium-efflux system ancillary protein KefC